MITNPKKNTQMRRRFRNRLRTKPKAIKAPGVAHWPSEYKHPIPRKQAIPYDPKPKTRGAFGS